MARDRGSTGGVRAAGGGPPAAGAAPGRDVATALWLALFGALFLILLVRNFVLGASEIGIVHVGPVVLAPFGPLVSLGVLFGIHLMHRWADRFGLVWEDAPISLRPTQRLTDLLAATFAAADTGAD